MTQLWGSLSSLAFFQKKSSLIMKSPFGIALFFNFPDRTHLMTRLWCQLFIASRNILPCCARNSWIHIDTGHRAGSKYCMNFEKTKVHT